MYRVDEAVCTGCGDCVAVCPAGAIALVDGGARIDHAICAECGRCADACPQGAITMVITPGPVYAAIKGAGNQTAIAPLKTVEAAEALRQRSDGELLPAETQRSRIWPLVGGALIWAARELLPEVLAAWRASRANASQPIGRKSSPLGVAVFGHRRSGHRHRRGHA